ncbi:MAG TPA: hypothetical protein VMU43_11515 [Candidatus Acidoferrum sp.]|nr:hypothetical protein [Candidatus Acidoferrum sp.]
MNRRQFVHLTVLGSAAIAAFPALVAEEAPPVPVRLNIRPDRVANAIRGDFMGLSYESAQLGDPEFFSGDNIELAGFMKRLGTSGVLRIGGNTSEYCYWTPNLEPTARRAGTAYKPAGPVGPDKGLKAPPSVKIGSQAIRNLRDFLDETGWSLIYGLNMGTGAVKDAVDEAAYVTDTIGPKLIAFQLCNEPDLFYRNGIRAKDYAFAKFADEWQNFFQAIRARLPKAPFAGPDTAYNNEWLVPFVERFKSDIRFVSSHYYAEGPPTDPSMTIDRLMRPSSKLEAEFAGMKSVVSGSGVPFRLAETNSCYSGGKQGVSDTFASALWGGDLMYSLASEGGIGINFHGGGYGWYTPIAGTRENGFMARPIYYGLLLFAQAGSGQLVDAKLGGVEQAPLLTAYALKKDAKTIQVVVFNKNLDRAVEIALDAGTRVENASALRLIAPRADDTTDVTLGAAPVGASGAWSEAHTDVLRLDAGKAQMALPAASAALITLITG